MNGTTTKVEPRWMIFRDLPEILDIEAASFDPPWLEEDFLRALRQPNCIGMVAEHGIDVVAFIVYELHKSRLHLLNIGVHPKWRRHKIGAQMIKKLISKCSSHRRTKIAIDVDEKNLAALLFLRSQGFRATRLGRGHLDDGGDVIRLEYRLGAEVEEPVGVNRVAQFEDN